MTDPDTRPRSPRNSVSGFPDASVRDLLALYVGSLEELQRRGLVRSVGSPIGDLVEHAVWRAVGGELEPKSPNGHTVTAPDGSRVLVRSRAMPRDTEITNETFPPFRTWEFDRVVFVLFDATDFRVAWARELTMAETRLMARQREGTASFVVTIRGVVRSGDDVSQQVRGAYDALR